MIDDDFIDDDGHADDRYSVSDESDSTIAALRRRWAAAARARGDDAAARAFEASAEEAAEVDAAFLQLHADNDDQVWP